MNRRPSKSRTRYDAFSKPAHFTASTPGNDFFDVRRKKPFIWRISLYFFLLFLAVILGNFLVNQFVHVARVDVPVTGLTEEFDGYTLLHISDLKGKSFGGDQRLLSFALSDCPFDAALLTGDMVSPLGNAEPLYALVDQLKALNPDAPVYFIAGDDDPSVTSDAYYDSGSPFAPWVLGMFQRGAQLLSYPQTVAGETQTLYLTTGSHLNLDLDTMQRLYEQQYIAAMTSGNDNEIELATHNLMSLENTRAARKTLQESDVVITLAHTPPTAEELSAAAYRDIDLLLCGHTLGGLIRLPLVGPVFIPSQNLPHYGLFPGGSASFGLIRYGHTSIYTSPGLGTANDDYPAFFFRLFNPPTVTLITLTPSSI